jgi:hypothetical protein
MITSLVYDFTTTLFRQSSTLISIHYSKDPIYPWVMKVAISVKCQIDIICYWNSCFWTSWQIVKGFHCFMGKIELCTNYISLSWFYLFLRILLVSYFTFHINSTHGCLHSIKPWMHTWMILWNWSIVSSSHTWFQRPTSSISNAIIQRNSIVALSKGGNISLYIYTIWTTFVQACA